VGAGRRSKQQQVKGEVHYRISKGHGRVMIFVAFLFDLLPLLLIIGVITLMFTYFGGSAVTNLASNYDECVNGTEVTTGGGRNYRNKAGGQTRTVRSERACAEVAWVGLTGVASVGVGGFMVGPIIYFIGSLISVVLSFLLFVTWFAFRGVAVVNLDPRRMIVNIRTLIAEILPVINIFPTITLAARRHVKISQQEDEVKHQRKMQGQLQA
jgi:hypothetical protein